MKSKTILLVGGSGFIGSALGEKFTDLGWNLLLLTRKIRPFQTSFPCEQILWDGVKIPEKALKSVDAIINLAGEGIANKSWSTSYRKKILDSRVNSTRALVKAVASAEVKPKVLIQASAVGYFGLDQREKNCSEGSEPGHDFLAEVCQAWEGEAKKLPKETRLCIPRFGVVLGWSGGALAQLWDVYTSGLGSVLGSGKQWMNWIHLEDLINFVVLAVLEEKYSGTYNLIAPENLDNKDFHRFLTKETASLKYMKTPGFLLKTVMGSRANLLLKGPKVCSKRLATTSFTFKYPSLFLALKALLSERKNSSTHYFCHKQWVPFALETVWDFFSSPENLAKMTHPSSQLKIKEPFLRKMSPGAKIEYSLRVHRVPVTWKASIEEYSPQFLFSDKQEKGPFKFWLHQHLFSSVNGGTLIEDRVEYKLPFFPFGQIAFPFVRKDLEALFRYRKEALVKALV